MNQNFEMKNRYISRVFIRIYCQWNLTLTMDLKDDQIELNNDTTVRFKFIDKPNCTSSDKCDEDESYGPYQIFKLNNFSDHSTISSDSDDYDDDSDQSFGIDDIFHLYHHDRKFF